MPPAHVFRYKHGLEHSSQEGEMQRLTKLFRTVLESLTQEMPWVLWVRVDHVKDLCSSPEEGSKLSHEKEMEMRQCEHRELISPEKPVNRSLSKGVCHSVWWVS